MRFVQKNFLIWVLLCLLSSPIEASSYVRVGLFKNVSKVDTGGTSYFEIIDKNTGDVVALHHGAAGDLSIYANSTGIKILEIGEFKGPLIIAPVLGYIKVNGARFRGNIEIVRHNLLTIINIIDLEEYLYGVIKCEISPNWPQEVLKAQAIIARTFALSNLEKHIKDGYNLCNQVHCQVYGGVEHEYPRILTAVDETHSMVLTYEDTIAQTVYHACCGGHTASASDVWGTKIPYLEGKECPFCKGSKYYRWSITLSEAEISSALNKNGFGIGSKIASIRTEHSSDGRVTNMIITSSNGNTVTIKGRKFRSYVGEEIIHNTKFNVSKKGDNFVFTGNGRGHGVGFCQEGAKSMAEQGYTFKEILGFYYPGLYLQKIVFPEPKME